MPSYRDIGKQYEISPARYRELLYFCKQYDEKMAVLRDCYSLSGSALTGLPKAPGAGESATERRALRAAPYSAEIDLIERCLLLAVDSDECIVPSLRENIIHGISYEYLGVPCARSKFYYEYRRKFFYILDREQLRIYYQAKIDTKRTTNLL